MFPREKVTMMSFLVWQVFFSFVTAIAWSKGSIKYLRKGMVIFIQTQMFPREKVTMMSFLVLNDGIWSLLWILAHTYTSLLSCPTTEAAALVTYFTQRSGAKVLIEYFGTLKGVSKIPLDCSLVILQATKPRWASQCLCHTCHTVSVTNPIS